MFKIVIDITNDEKIIFRQCLKFETLKKAEKVFKNLYDDIYIVYGFYANIYLFEYDGDKLKKRLQKSTIYTVWGSDIKPIE